MVTMDVSARELKLHLGQYLDAVAGGQTVRVTRHGKVVAELAPPALTAAQKIERLIAQGRITVVDRGKLPDFEPVRAPGSGTQAILDERNSYYDE